VAVAVGAGGAVAGGGGCAAAGWAVAGKDHAAATIVTGNKIEETRMA